VDWNAICHTLHAAVHPHTIARKKLGVIARITSSFALLHRTLLN
jgi:hypothetical protein